MMIGLMLILSFIPMQPCRSLELPRHLLKRKEALRVCHENLSSAIEKQEGELNKDAYTDFIKMQTSGAIDSKFEELPLPLVLYFWDSVCAIDPKCTTSNGVDLEDVMIHYPQDGHRLRHRICDRVNTYLFLNILTFSPTSVPTTLQPTKLPSRQPSEQLTALPTSWKTDQPSQVPSGRPTQALTFQPSDEPSFLPSMFPTKSISLEPSTRPSTGPTIQPSINPTLGPSSLPTIQSTTNPSPGLSSFPSLNPTINPTIGPSSLPTIQPTTNPSLGPSRLPTIKPTMNPTLGPSNLPTMQPTTNPSLEPSSLPTIKPTKNPTLGPSNLPTTQPTTNPSLGPSSLPSIQPTTNPSLGPSSLPSAYPTMNPSLRPSIVPSLPLTKVPTSPEPTVSPSVSSSPSFVPFSTSSFSLTFTFQYFENQEASINIGEALKVCTSEFVRTTLGELGQKCAGFNECDYFADVAVDHFLFDCFEGFVEDSEACAFVDIYTYVGFYKSAEIDTIMIENLSSAMKTYISSGELAKCVFNSRYPSV